MADIDAIYICNYSKERTVKSHRYKIEVITDRLSNSLTVFDIQEIVNSLEKAKQYFKDRIAWYEKR